jgi:hypothetical protein
MDEHNFWFWLLTGLEGMADRLTGAMPIYAPVGLGSVIYGVLAGVMTPILFYLGSFFNLCWFALCLTIMAASETARAGVAVYRTLVKFIPLP